MNKTPSFPLAVSAPAAFDPFGAQSAFSKEIKEILNAPAAPEALQDYLVDAAERSVLLMDLLRERGNEQADMASRPLATVLTFGHEILLSGKSLRRPINYSLARVIRRRAHQSIRRSDRSWLSIPAPDRGLAFVRR